jgi:hypothetical protein
MPISKKEPDEYHRQDENAETQQRADPSWRAFVQEFVYQITHSVTIICP